MGQKRPVQIVNFVAKGTIEEGMLSVLAFKRSLAAGVLDGGSGEISLGGSRLNRFMKEVENVTGHMGEGEAMTPAEENPAVGLSPAKDSVPADKASAVEAAPQDAPDPPPADPWAALAQIGGQLLSALSAGATTGQAAHPWVSENPQTGERRLRIPLPPPETAQQIASPLEGTAQLLQARR